MTSPLAHPRPGRRCKLIFDTAVRVAGGTSYPYPSGPTAARRRPRGDLSVRWCMEYVPNVLSRPMRLQPFQSRKIARALIALLLTLPVTGAVAAASVHLALVKSEPANAATVGKSPKAITLWFSQQPNVKLTRLVLTHESDTVNTGAAAAVDSAGKQIRIPVNATLAQGKYAVTWRTLARDGHAVSGKFTFTMDSAAAVHSGSSSTAPSPR